MIHISFIEKLLGNAEVVWGPLSQVAKIKHGKDWKKLGEGEVPVYGSGGIMCYVDTFAYDKPTVLIPRKGTITNVFYVDTPFWNVDTIYYTEIEEKKINPKFFYYFMKTVDLMALDTGAGRPSLTQAILNKLLVPIPCPENPQKSLDIQNEIVRILDTFTSLTAELEVELNARKKQYSYYRDQLLSFEDGEVEWKVLGEVCEKITSGKNKDKSNTGLYPVFGSTGIIGRTNNKVYENKNILVARVGANAGRVNIAKGEYDVSDNTLILQVQEDISLKYLYYYLVNLNLNRFTKGAGQPLLTAGQLKAMLVPVPSAEEQDSIVAILDKFDALTNSSTEGLPREIELRQKQYEYYRDLLLSFPKPDVTEAM